MTALPENTSTWDLDRCAWNIISSWHDTAKLTAPHDGIDRALIFRSLLWDKVGRAIRLQNEIGDVDFELKLWRESRAPTEKGALLWAGKHRRRLSPSSFSQLPVEPRAKKRNIPLLYFAVPTRLVLPVATHFAHSSTCQIMRPFGDAAGFEEVPAAPFPNDIPAADVDFVMTICHDMIDAISQSGVDMLQDDRHLLAEQMLKEEQRLQRIIRELTLHRPDCIVIHADNHPPYIQYTLVAQLLDIPVVLIQHGLDCERYYLDDGYADHFLLWGQDRKYRYLSDSRRPILESQIHITGNPHMSKTSISSIRKGAIKRLLWTTRPHSSQKCYLPSRTPDEGKHIMRALLNAAAQNDCTLMIKAHPADYEEVYRRLAAESGQEVTFCHGQLTDIMTKADAVISEDSTAGLDAMISSLPLIHAHLCPSAPVMQFTNSSSALPGFSEEQLIESFSALASGHFDSDSMQSGQTVFMKNNLLLDGNSALMSIVHNISDIMTRQV